jgi:hypothetical protein
MLVEPRPGNDERPEHPQIPLAFRKDEGKIESECRRRREKDVITAVRFWMRFAEGKSGPALVRQKKTNVKVSQAVFARTHPPSQTSADAVPSVDFLPF